MTPSSKEKCGRHCHFTFSDDEIKRYAEERVREDHKLRKKSRSALVIEYMEFSVTDNHDDDDSYHAVDKDNFGGEALMNMNTHEVSTQRLIA